MWKAIIHLSFHQAKKVISKLIKILLCSKSMWMEISLMESDRYFNSQTDTSTVRQILQQSDRYFNTDIGLAASTMSNLGRMWFRESSHLGD